MFRQILRDDFRIVLVISPREWPEANEANISDIRSGLVTIRGKLHWPEAKPKANTAARGLITRPIRKSSRNDIFINQP